MDDFKPAVYLIVDEMRGMATVQKLFSQNIYEQERAERMMGLAAKLAALAENVSPLDLQDVFTQEPWIRFSPIIGVDAAVFNKEHEILLIQRCDNEHWAMPWEHSEIGHTTVETALRGLWEEAGLRGRVVCLLGVFDGRLWNSHSRFHLIHPVFQVERDSLEPSLGTEALDARFFLAIGFARHFIGGTKDAFMPVLRRWKEARGLIPPMYLALELPMHQRPNPSEA